jgi:hypothetical protein
MGGGAMPRIYDDILVRCPYFLHNGRRSIVCEGITDDSTITLSYLDECGRNLQRKLFCNGKFENCEIYRMLTEGKYDE